MTFYKLNITITYTILVEKVCTIRHAVLIEEGALTEGVRYSAVLWIHNIDEICMTIREV